MDGLDAYIGAKIDEAVDAYDGSSESVKENIETIDDALAVSEERQKWKQAIKNIRAELIQDIQNGVIIISKGNEHLFSVIDNHTKELMK